MTKALTLPARSRGAHPASQRSPILLAAFAASALVPCLAPSQAEAAAAGPTAVYTITPCRILDTRLGSGIYAGKLSPGDVLDLKVSGTNIVLQGGSTSNCPDIPPNAWGVFVNVIAVETEGQLNNDLGIKPWGSSRGATAINYDPGIFAINNGLLVGTCYGQSVSGSPPPSGTCDQDLTLTNGTGGSANVVIDVTGYTAGP